MRHRTAAISAALLLAILLGGCGGDTLLAYIGGGLPPGDGDIGGVVVASTATVAAATVPAQTPADTVPVAAAEVVLSVGSRQVGTAVTGDDGYFRFVEPASGNYEVTVNPPEDSGLRQVRRRFRHQGGRQTFLTIVLEPAP